MPRMASVAPLISPTVVAIVRNVWTGAQGLEMKCHQPQDKYFSQVIASLVGSVKT